MPVKSRRLAREAALKALYEVDVGKQEPDEAVEYALLDTPTDQETADFARSLVHGVMEKRDELDELIEGLSRDWALARQACIDRNVMRIAAYELLYLAEIPPAATINEAVELVKKYSTADSGRFVNGVLGALADSAAVKGTV